MEEVGEGAAASEAIGDEHTTQRRNKRVMSQEGRTTEPNFTQTQQK